MAVRGGVAVPRHQGCWARRAGLCAFFCHCSSRGGAAAAALADRADAVTATSKPQRASTVSAEAGAGGVAGGVACCVDCWARAKACLATATTARMA